MLKIDPKDAVPIWKQIEEGVRRLVASGALQPGGLVPSVRDLARELQVNPMTVSKAYQRLGEAGLLEVRRGEGTFVASSPPSLPRGQRSRVIGQAATRYVAAIANLGASREEALQAVRDAWEETVRGGKR
jgi:GntR family transcriptional regulator